MTFMNWSNKQTDVEIVYPFNFNSSFSHFPEKKDLLLRHLWKDLDKKKLVICHPPSSFPVPSPGNHTPKYLIFENYQQKKTKKKQPGIKKKQMITTIDNNNSTNIWREVGWFCSGGAGGGGQSYQWKLGFFSKTRQTKKK